MDFSQKLFLFLSKKAKLFSEYAVFYIKVFLSQWNMPIGKHVRMQSGIA